MLANGGDCADCDSGAVVLPGADDVERHARQQHDNAAVRFKPEARRCSARIGKDGGAFRNHGLAHVDFRHRAAEAAKAFLNVP